MKTIIYSIAIAVIFSITAFSTFKVGRDRNAARNSDNGFVVMELYTSQGCSSCPAADAVLGKFTTENRANIIPISFHVDYWNYIGWKDPYSKSEYSKRQRFYAQKLNASVYTPQLVINGKYEMIGSVEKPIRDRVATELKIAPTAEIDMISATLKDGRLTVKYNCTTTGNNYLNIALVKKKAITNVGRGENSGRKLTNFNTVTDFVTKPLTEKSGEIFFTFGADKIPSEYSVITYIQEKIDGKILAASKNEIQ